MVQTPAHIQSLRPYVPGTPIEELARRHGLPVSSIVKLASNENPLGASRKALRAIAAAKSDVSLYPDNDCFVLSEALSRFHGLPPERFVIGCGSEGVLGMAASAFLCEGRETVFPKYSFQAFGNAVQRVGAISTVVDLKPGFQVDLDAMLAAISPRTSLVYLANPGNPTGTRLDNAQIEAFLARLPSHVVLLLDEAYREYALEAQTDPVQWTDRCSNLLVTRTFSKAYGLAGLRVGYGVTTAALAKELQRVRPPFSVSELAQAGAAAALDDREFLAETARVNRAGLEQLQAGFAALGLEYVPSSGNFVLVKVGDGKNVADALGSRGLIVRPVANYGLPEWLRVSVGLAEHNQRLLNALAEVVAPA